MRQVKSNKNKARRRAREIALQAGYMMDFHNIGDVAEASLRFIDFTVNNEISEDEVVMNYARELTLGTVEHNAEIDTLIRTNMTGWRPERMAATDRAAVRLALFEGVIAKKVDLPVAISEAVELARLFGSDESARFVNGVLGKIARAS